MKRQRFVRYYCHECSSFPYDPGHAVLGTCFKCKRWGEVNKVTITRMVKS